MGKMSREEALKILNLNENPSNVAIYAAYNLERINLSNYVDADKRTIRKNLIESAFHIIIPPTLYSMEDFDKNSVPGLKEGASKFNNEIHSLESKYPAEVKKISPMTIIMLSKCKSLNDIYLLRKVFYEEFKAIRWNVKKEELSKIYRYVRECFIRLQDLYGDNSDEIVVYKELFEIVKQICEGDYNYLEDSDLIALKLMEFSAHPELLNNAKKLLRGLALTTIPIYINHTTGSFHYIKKHNSQLYAYDMTNKQKGNDDIVSEIDDEILKTQYTFIREFFKEAVYIETSVVKKAHPEIEIPITEYDNYYPIYLMDDLLLYVRKIDDPINFKREYAFDVKTAMAEDCKWVIKGKKRTRGQNHIDPERVYYRIAKQYTNEIGIADEVINAYINDKGKQF